MRALRRYPSQKTSEEEEEEEKKKNQKEERCRDTDRTLEREELSKQKNSECMRATCFLLECGVVAD